MQRATTLTKKSWRDSSARSPRACQRTEPGQAWRYIRVLGRACLALARGHAHGIISLTAWNGNTIKSKKAL